MYNFSHFKEQDEQNILNFIEDHPFAFLTGSTKDGKPVATQVPILLSNRDGDLCIQGHIMRNTDHHRAFKENPSVLAVFTGPNAYVSASWYSTPSMGATWNYMSVYVYGQIRMMSDSERVELMKTLTLKFEDGNTASPTVLDNLAPDYQRKMLPAIDGFEIKIESIENVFKLSQDRDKESYQNIISKLEQRGGNSKLISDEMKKRMLTLFK